MRFLIVDDDFISRSLMLAIVSKYGRCDVAVSSDEALLAFKLARKDKDPYSAIFLDILMPEKNGTFVLNEIKAFEESRKFRNSDRTKIIMVSSVDDPKEILSTFKDQCDAYLIKPIKHEKILEKCEIAGLKMVPLQCS